MRRYVCRECRRDAEVETVTGPLPTVCDTCLGPEKAKARREGRAKQNLSYQQRVAVRALRAQLTELEEEQSAVGAADPARRLMDTSETPRHALGIAVRKLATAEGAAETVQALSFLERVTVLWKQRLLSGQINTDAA